MTKNIKNVKNTAGKFNDGRLEPSKPERGKSQSFRDHSSSPKTNFQYGVMQLKKHFIVATITNVN